MKNSESRHFESKMQKGKAVDIQIFGIVLCAFELLKCLLHEVHV